MQLMSNLANVKCTLRQGWKIRQVKNPRKAIHAIAITRSNKKYGYLQWLLMRPNRKKVVYFGWSDG